MKKIFFILLISPFIALGQSPTDTTSMKISEETFDFGNIPQGIPVTHIFEVTNTSKAPLLISQATASCGCTTPVWTKDPILPGKKGTIAVTFNAEKEGSFLKTVTILTNTPDPKYIYIKGNVLPKTTDGEQH